MRPYSNSLAVVALALCFVAGGATRAQAGLGDVIWGMSGPQMYGYGFLRCRTPIAGGTTQCSLVERRLGNKLERDTIENRRAWVNLEGTIYTSGTKDAGKYPLRGLPYESCCRSNRWSKSPPRAVATCGSFMARD